MSTTFSGPITDFHGKILPRQAIPAGYAALIDAYDLQVPLPYVLYATNLKHTSLRQGDWQLLTRRYQPESSLAGHLAFALKYEGVDLCVLKKLFDTISEQEIIKLVQNTPTGSYSRRIWFLYEWLTGTELDLPDLERGNYVDVIDTEQQFAIQGVRSRRHRVMNNLPGTPEFCPLIRKTAELETWLSVNLQEQAVKVSTKIPKDVMSRAAAFLLLKDSQASFTIEHEAAPHNRIESWGRAIQEAGKYPIDNEVLIRLQRIVMGDQRFVSIGFRKEGGFIGEHDLYTGTPRVEHVSAKPDDILPLIQGMTDYMNTARTGIDPIAIAAAASLGFVLIHPFADGNGRIHRYLIHHVLAENSYTPPGVVFPISASILKRIDEYGEILRGYSRQILPFIRWEPTIDHNVHVTNETIDYYRYFDATPFAEFLYQCVQDTIEHDLPEEADYLIHYDRFRVTIQKQIAMPDKTVYLLYRFLSQNKGVLSKRAREKEFSLLTDDEIDGIERLYMVIFGD